MIARCLSVAAALITLAACGKFESRDFDRPGGVPKDIDFKSGDPLTDKEFAEGLELYRIIDNLGRIDEQVMRPKDESAEAAKLREELAAELTDAEKTLADQLRAACPSAGDKKTDKKLKNPPQPGDTITEYWSLVAGGPDCPGTFQEKHSATFTLVEQKDNGGKIELKMNITGSAENRTEFQKPEHAAIARFRQMELITRFSGTAEDGANEKGQITHRAFSKFTGTGHADLVGGFPIAKLRRIDLRIEADYLLTKLDGKIEKVKTILYFHAKGDTTREYRYAYEIVRDGSNVRVTRFLIGDRELTPEQQKNLKVQRLARRFASAGY